MNFERACHGCFREKSTQICPYCDYDPAQHKHPTLALAPGTLLGGRYMAGTVLGVGGFGITYLGYDLTLDIKVAIKEYLPGGMATRQSDGYHVSLLASKDEAQYRSGEERFLDEARILAKLQNTPNIVSVQNYFRENNTAYFVMDYIEGMSLKAYLQSQGGSIPYEQALSILLPIMEALSRVHAQSLLHRDISPDNIYITTGGQSKLLDFGAARFAVGDNKSISIILKHGYAPEEQYRAHGNQGPWTDVYAMGATFYHCITGALPPDSVERLANDTLKPPSALGVRIPPPAEAALLRALAVKAEDRFANMPALIGALCGKAAVEQGVSSTVALNAQRITAQPEKQQSAVRSFFARLQTDKKLLGVTIGGGILVLALIITPVALLWGNKKAPAGGDEPIFSSTADATLIQSTPQSTPAPAGTPLLGKTRPYTDEPLNLSMDIPVDMLVQPGELGFMLERSQCTSIVCGFSYYSVQPLYTLADFETNLEAIIAEEMEGLGFGSWSIRNSGPSTVNTYPAYRVDIQLAAGQNAEMTTLAFPPVEGQGLYLLHIAQRLDDPDLAKHRLENEAMLQSILFAGPPQTGMTVYESRYMDVKFVYADALLPGGMEEFPAQDGLVAHVQLYVQDRKDIGIFLEDASGYAESIEDALAIIDDGLKNIDPNAAFGKPYTQMLGAKEYTIKEYAIKGADTGEAFDVFFAIAEVDGKLYSWYVWYTEDAAEQVMAQLFAAMTTLSTK